MEDLFWGKLVYRIFIGDFYILICFYLKSGVGWGIKCLFGFIYFWFLFVYELL